MGLNILTDGDDEVIASAVVDLSIVTFVVSVKGGKLILRPGQPNPLLVAYMASISLHNRFNPGPPHRAVILTSTHPGGVVGDVVSTARAWMDLVSTLGMEPWSHVKSYPGCGDEKSDDLVFVPGMDRERADILADRWGQIAYVDIDLEKRPDGRPELVFPGAR